MKRKFSPSFRELGACKTIAIILLYITMEILVGKNYRGGFFIFAQQGGGVNAKIFNRGVLMKNRLQGGVLETCLKNSKKIKRKCKKMFLEYAKTIKNSSVLENIFGF